jgi:hypothetical protein
MSIIFNPDVFIPENGFNAVFLTQASYMNLLQLVNVSVNGYDFNGFNFNIQQLPYSYMYISRNPSRFRIGLGKSVNLKITNLGFCKSSLTVIALVALKNNFTDKQVPHIVISGNRSAAYEFNLDDFKLIPLHAPYTVHGKLGIMPDGVDSSQSNIKPHFNPQNQPHFNPQNQPHFNPQNQPHFNPQNQPQNQTVNKPELTLTVDNSPPPGSDEKEEFYMGHKIHKGERGGKYYFTSDGLKRYLTKQAIANSKKKEEVVYNINLLSSQQFK